MASLLLLIFVLLYAEFYQRLRTRKPNKILGEDAHHIRQRFDYGPPGNPICMVALLSTIRVMVWGGLACYLLFGIYRLLLSFGAHGAGPPPPPFNSLH
jgi:hypothetical protein